MNKGNRLGIFSTEGKPGDNRPSRPPRSLAFRLLWLAALVSPVAFLSPLLSQRDAAAQQALPESHWSEHGGQGPAPMAYDTARKQVVATSGGGSVGIWDESSKRTGWRSVAAPGPSPSRRDRPAMAYDEIRQQMVFFGGANSPACLGADNNSVCGDTWTWDGNKWTKHNFPANAPVPRPRSSAAMAWDGQNVVLFGGQGVYNGNNYNNNDTWTWDGTAWTKRDLTTLTDPCTPQVDGSPNPAGRNAHAMAYDSTRGTVVMYGGASTVSDCSSSTAAGDTWVWDGRKGLWLRMGAGPGVRLFASMADYPLAQEVILFGGYDGAGDSTRTQASQETWSWNGAAWAPVLTQASPEPRREHGMAYDAARQEIVLAGGAPIASARLRRSTWTFGVKNARPLLAPGSAQPRLDSISPTQGPSSGGTRVKLVGEGLTGALGISFGDRRISCLPAACDIEPTGRTLSATTPPHAPGDVDVTVTTPFGTTNAVSYSFLPGGSRTRPGSGAPHLDAITPGRGALGGGYKATLTGTNLAGASQVDFGGKALLCPSESCRRLSAGEITVRVPAGDRLGKIAVKVAAPMGLTNGVDFTYEPPGPLAGGFTGTQGAAATAGLAGSPITPAGPPTSPSLSPSSSTSQAFSPVSSGSPVSSASSAGSGAQAPSASSSASAVAQPGAAPVPGLQVNPGSMPGVAGAPQQGRVAAAPGQATTFNMVSRDSEPVLLLLGLAMAVGMFGAGASRCRWNVPSAAAPALGYRRA